MPDPETSSPNEYLLTPEERGLLQQLDARAMVQKARIHDLNVELEPAKAALQEAQAAFNGAHAALIVQRGWQEAEITSDRSKMIRKA
jgi:hypothetical protein